MSFALSGGVYGKFAGEFALLGIVHSFNSFSFFSNIFLSFCSLILLFAFDTLLTRLKRWVYGKGTI